MLELYSKITITIVLYQENLETISKSLENLKSFKIIIIDNANDLNFLGRLRDFVCYKLYLLFLLQISFLY